MFYRSIQVLAIVLTGMLGCAVVSAQSADNSTPINPRNADKEDPPANVREMLVKLQIERDKKDHDEMLARGKQALELSNELEKAAAENKQLSDKDRAKLETLEKLAKKIRNELGGGDDDDPATDEQSPIGKPKSYLDGFKTLQSAAAKLVDELQKTTRFSISAAAIQTTNSFLRITRYLRFGK
jgi:hypothetical protein